MPVAQRDIIQLQRWHHRALLVLLVISKNIAVLHHALRVLRTTTVRQRQQRASPVLRGSILFTVNIVASLLHFLLCFFKSSCSATMHTLH